MKRLTILLLAATMPLVAAASPAPKKANTHKITVQIDNATDTMLLLGYYYAQNRYILDTAYNNGHGKFVFQGSAEIYPGLYFFTNNNDRLTEFVIYKEKPFFSLHTDNSAWTMHMKAKGSNQNEIFSSYQKESEAIYLDIEKKRPTLDSAAFALYQHQQHQRIDSIKLAYINKYPDAMFAKMIAATKNIDELVPDKHPDGTSTTQEALLADLREDPKRTTLYLALGRPCVLPFFRVHPFLGLPEALQPMESPHKALERHLEEDDTATLPGADPALLESRKLQTLLEPMYRTCSLKARQAADDLFAQALSENSAWAEDQPSLHDVLERDNALADRIVVMKDGYIQQVGTPRDLYFEPANVFVAGFIGEPPMNFVKGTLTGGKLAFGDQQIDLSGKFADKLQGHEGKDIVFGFRPEAIILGEAPDSYNINCNVELTEMLGDNTNVYITAGDQQAILKVDPHDTPETDKKLVFSIPYKSVYLFDGESELVL